MLLSHRIKELREKKGLTQAELARLCKVKRQYIASVEAGKQIPSKKLLFALAKALEISFSRLQKFYEDARLEMKIKRLGIAGQEGILLVKEILKLSPQKIASLLKDIEKK